MKLYGVPLSVHTRKVQLALRAKGLNHDLSVVIPIAPDTIPENWAQLSPTGLIPVLEDGDFTLPDSGAILQYLDAAYPDQPIIPTDARERGKAVWIEAYLGSFFREVLHPLFHERVVAAMQGRSPDEDAIKQLMTGPLPRYLAYLDSISDGEWLVGSELSLADIAVGANLVLFHYLGESVPAESYPSLKSYFERLIKTPVFVSQIEAEKPFADQMGLSQAALVA